MEEREEGLCESDATRGKKRDREGKARGEQDRKEQEAQKEHETEKEKDTAAIEQANNNKDSSHPLLSLKLSDQAILNELMKEKRLTVLAKNK